MKKITIFSTLIVTLTLIVELVNTQGTDDGKTKKIGNYVIPEDNLKDNFCKSID